MDKILQNDIDSLVGRYPALVICRSDIEKAYDVLEECFASGHKLLIAGNGGSASDSDHIVGELMKGFKSPRKCSPEFADRLKNVDPILGTCLAEKLQGALPAIALHNHAALNTAFCNDVSDGNFYSYAQQVFGYGQKGDVLLGISTSGNSQNILNAATTAKAIGLKIIGLTGQSCGKLLKYADVMIKAPEVETYKIQELHVPIYHSLCLMLEKRFWRSI